MSAVADEISLKKKQEVLSAMYMKTRNYITPARSVLYVLCGLVMGIGILLALITWFASGIVGASIVGSIGALLPFGLVSILGFLFLGLTQETAAREPMPWSRALAYVAAAGFILFGALVALITFFGVTEYPGDRWSYGYESVSMTGALAVLMVFVLPGIALGVFLILSEKDRSKPWVVNLQQEAYRRDAERFGGSAGQERFGLICGAIWIAAVAGFIVLTMTVGLKFSWLAIAAALVIQMVVMAVLTKRT
jgi:MFS family permease